MKKKSVLISILFAFTLIYGISAQQNKTIEQQMQALDEVQAVLKNRAEEMNIISNKHTPASIPIDKVYKNLVVKKMFKNKTETKEVTFKATNDFEKWRISDVDDKFMVNINGGCEVGNIKITIYEPSGKIFKEISLDSSANLSWSQYVLFTMEKKYQGTWKAKIEATDALGYYELKFSIIYAPWPGSR